MHRVRRALQAVVAMGALTCHGCVELTGQRFTFFHDAARDTFYVLIQYDGIHEANGRSEKGTVQIPGFVANREILLLDWPGYLSRQQRDRWRQGGDPVWRGVARLFDRLQVEVLGHYREPDGRVGAAQLVTIPRFRSFLEEVNRLLNQGWSQANAAAEVARVQQAGGPWRSLRALFAAARRNHTWVRADGHALRCTVPVHADEWTATKGDQLLAAFQALAGLREPAAVERWLRAAGGMPLSYRQVGDTVALTVGDPAAPRTLHWHLREVYNQLLERVVAEQAPRDLDAALRQALLDPAAAPVAALQKVRPWLAPEVEVGALLSATAWVKDDARRRVLATLDAWGQRWNDRRGFPTAPLRTDLDEDRYLAAWRAWYERRRQRAGAAAGRRQAGIPVTPAVRRR